MSAQPVIAQTPAQTASDSSQKAAASAQSTDNSSTGQAAGPRVDPSPSDEDQAIARKMFGTGRVTPDRSRGRCAKASRTGEIVVCGPEEDSFRVKSTAESDPNSRQATRDGALHTPDVAGNGIFKGKATLGKMCLIGGCPPEAAYMIDLSSIPEAPAGSDADKIAKGELRAP